MNRMTQRFALASLALLAASAECMAQSQVLFSRSATYSDGSFRYSNVFRINADGTGLRQLTPTTDGISNGAAAWSPNGTYIAYSRYGWTAGRGDIYLMTNNGAGRRRVTSGTGNCRTPVWRPDGGRIAFVADYGTRSCITTVRPDGVDQRDAFCATPPWYIQSVRPQWSRDSTRLFVAISMAGSGLEPPIYSRAYRVNPSTGGATLLTSQVLEYDRDFHFSPDGTRGLYGSWQGGLMHVVDFASDVMTPLTEGFDPVFSNNGAVIAFSRTQFGGAPDFNRFANIFVINVNGSGERQVTRTTANDVEYTVADWSRSNTHMLVNRTLIDWSPTGRNTNQMRIISLATGTGNWLPQGYASDWYQGP